MGFSLLCLPGHPVLPEQAAERGAERYEAICIAKTSSYIVLAGYHDSTIYLISYNYYLLPGNIDVLSILFLIL